MIIDADLYEASLLSMIVDFDLYEVSWLKRAQ